MFSCLCSLGFYQALESHMSIVVWGSEDLTVSHSGASVEVGSPGLELLGVGGSLPL